MINTDDIDDNEYARYLASYIKLMENKVIDTAFDGYSPYINEDKLYKLIKEYLENLP